ncbi:MAG TPA: prepilin-type N-terminal cleavage/methylation domain-containing protein [Rhodospirillaceae bacterium]|nr:prepilin-type N-terminal cleavage/methylation domain-containing protein [Rhodospirillaceae bacterium]
MFESLKPLAWRGLRPGSHDDQQGFTLIEMSIVLVIIGLIVGGIIKGQEVVANGRLKTQVAQIDAVKSAVYSFQDKFSFLPGDFKANAVLGTVIGLDGNQDGYVAGSTGSAIVDDAAAVQEMSNAWAQLQAAGLLQGIQQTSTGSTTYLYPAKIPADFLWFGYFSTGPTGTLTTTNQVRIQSNGDITNKASPALRTPDAQSIDVKYDDGLPFQGSIMVSANTNTNCSGTGVNAAYSVGGAGTATSVSTKFCVMFWQF